jgi:hypothetical protein
MRPARRPERCPARPPPDTPPLATFRVDGSSHACKARSSCEFLGAVRKKALENSIAFALSACGLVYVLCSLRIGERQTLQEWWSKNNYCAREWWSLRVVVGGEWLRVVVSGGRCEWWSEWVAK